MTVSVSAETKRRAGRPKKVTPAILAEVESLRARGVSWAEVAVSVALKPETCRRALWAVRKSRGAVGNSPNPIPGVGPGD
jgi:hypothetical protein